MTIANLETITDMQSWCRTWPLNGSRRIRAKTKNFTRNPEKLAKVPGTREGSQKSFTLTIPWNLAKSCEDLSWNHCTSTPHRSETNRYCGKSSAQSKGRQHLLYCCNQVWMKIGGQIPWNGIPICETYGTHLPSVVWRRLRAGQFLRLRWAGGGRMRRPSSCICLRNPKKQMLLH